MVVENAERDVLVMAAAGETQDVILSAGAAQEVPTRVVGLDGLAQGWRTADVLFISADEAERVAGLALPPRDRVFLVGRDAVALATWSAPLGAQVIALPQGAAWLGAVLAGGGTGPGRAPVVAVLGGSGGVGASTLAATLACLSARKEAAALVDTDLTGGGIDLLLGAERSDGWRWPRLSGADGHVGELRRYLPVVEGVSLVSMARGPTPDLAREPLAAIIGSLRRGHRLVIVDPGRALTQAARESSRLATHVVLVVHACVRGVAAAREVLRTHQPDGAVAVLRRAGPAVSAAMVCEALGIEVVGTLPEDGRLPGAAERGEPPTRAGRAYRRACQEVLDLVGDGHE